MDSQALDEIHRFTASVEHTDLFAYIGVELDADAAAITHALRVRRSWAQGQQANPKFRQEALWLIKNIQMVKTAVLDDSQTYLKDLEQRTEHTKLETLTIFIKGILAGGELSVRGEEAIQQQADALGLDTGVVIRRIGEILAEQDAGTFDSASPPSSIPIGIEEDTDLYAILDAEPEYSQEDLEEAYRRRYRWARELRDTEKSSRVYEQLDEAWRVLQDPVQRAVYDEGRLQPASVAVAHEEGESLAFLPPPPQNIKLSLPVPSVEQHLERVLSAEMGESEGDDAEVPAQRAAITMPAAIPERGAPPPPEIPPVDMGDEPQSSSPDQEEPEFSIEDTEDVEAQNRHADLGASPSMGDRDPEATPPMMGDFNMDLIDMNFGAAAPAASAPQEPMDELIQMMSFDGPDREDKLAKIRAVTDNLSKNPDGLNLPEIQNTGGRPTLDAGQIHNDLAELQVEGPRLIRIRTGVHPFPVRITVVNLGEGRMSGQITADMPWVQISPKVLAPDRKKQVIEALVEPDLMPSNSGRAIITIDTDHGETRTVTIDALKHVVSPVVMFTAALSLVGIIAMFAGLYLSGAIGSQLIVPTRTVLAISVDPPAGEVYVDDTLVGNQGTLSMVDSFPVGIPFQVRVELDGFEPFIHEAIVNHGEQLRIEADLVLQDDVDYVPDAQMEEGTVDKDALDMAFADRAAPISHCFTRNLRSETPFTAELKVQCVVTDRGYIHGVTFTQANFRSPSVELCLRRQLRALHLPLVAGDYGRFERKLGAEIRPNTVLNAETTP